MSGKIYFYKGASRVKVVTESEGYWLIEALEDFVDYVDGERVSINVGERRLVPPDALNSEMVSSKVKTPVFEQQMEKKTIQRMVEESRDKKQAAELSGKKC
ncbi:MAG: hypothetical protein ACQCN5_12965 [Candidatus Bathyarchaeia archaeon]